MKIFAIYTNLVITNDPKWLDDFREKYDVPYEIHITLTQPRFVNDKDVSKIKKSVAKYFESKQLSSLLLNFSEYFLDRQDETEEGCIMISTNEKDMLSEIQRDLLGILAPYQYYFEEKTKNYEERFVPHITIGRHLSKDMFDEATSVLPQHVTVTAEVTEITLAVVADKSAKERKDPKNLTIFKLR